MAGTIQNLEVLSAGTWNASTGRVTVTESDLDEMVSNFAKLQGSNVVKPHLKLGHTEAQKWFGQENGIPVLGWITKVWRVGRKLLADVDSVPDALLDMIRQGRYHNVSSEIILDEIDVQGQKVRNILSAVALLGTEMPAAKDLAGLAAALFSVKLETGIDAKPTTINMEHNMPDLNPALFSQAQLNALIEAAVTKAVAEFKAKTEGEITDLNTQLEVVTKRADSAEGSLKKLQEDTVKAEATRTVDDAIKAGKLPPKMRDAALALMSAQGVVKFGEGEKSPALVFKDLLEGLSANVQLKELGSGKNNEHSVGDVGATVAKELDTKIKKLQGESGGATKLGYADAMKQVLDADPDLKARYAEQAA